MLLKKSFHGRPRQSAGPSLLHEFTAGSLGHSEYPQLPVEEMHFRWDVTSAAMTKDDRWRRNKAKRNKVGTCPSIYSYQRPNTPPWHKTDNNRGLCRWVLGSRWRQDSGILPTILLYLQNYLRIYIYVSTTKAVNPLVGGGYSLGAY